MRALPVLRNRNLVLAIGLINKRSIEVFFIIVMLLPLVLPASRASGFATTSASIVTSPTRFNGLNQTSSFGQIPPPDIQIAAGPNHLVEIVNRDVTIYSKTGTLLSHVSLNSFFNTGTDWTFDPRALYDTLSGRWFLMEDDGTPGNIHIAVSNSTTPTGWHYYVVGGSMTHCYDQPRIGVSGDKFVVSADATTYFSPPPGTACLGSIIGDQYWVLNKTDMVHFKGSVSNTTVTSLPTSFLSLQPMQALTSTNTIYMETTGEFTFQNVTLVTLNGVPPGIVSNTTTTIVTTAPASSAAVTSAPTPSSQYTVDLSDGDRMQSVAWYQGKLWSTFMVGCTPTGDNISIARSCIQLLELNTSSTPSILQNFDYATKGQYYFFPALSLDGYGNLDMIFGYSNTTTYPSLALTGQAWSDSANTMASRLTIKQGSSICSCGRYGDYFGAAPDPSNPALVWTNGEYYNASGFGGWNTFIASEQLLSPDFSLTAPSSVSCVQGASCSYTVTVTSLNGFSGTVLLSVSTQQGPTASVNPSSLSGSGTATVSTTPTVGGGFTITVTATSGSLSHSVSSNISVQGFYLVAGKSYIGNLNAGATGKWNIWVNLVGGYQGVVCLSVVSDPGLTTQMYGNCVNISTAVGLYVSAPSAGTYAATITGSDGSRTASVSISVQIVDFTITASPTTLQIKHGKSDISTLNLTSINGFTGTVTLSANVSPTISNGPTASPSPTSVTLSNNSATSTLTVSTTTSTPRQQYTVTITATSGSITHTSTVTVTVT